MAIPFLNHLDLRSVSELQNAILHKTTSGSASNVEGKIIYDTGSDTIKYYNGSSWISLSGQDANTFRTIKVDTTDNGLYLATGIPDGKPNGNGLVCIFKYYEGTEE